MTQKTETKTKQIDPNLLDRNLSAAISLAIELDGSFRLYSYRVITPEQFISRAEELISFHKSMSNG